MLISSVWRDYSRALFVVGLLFGGVAVGAAIGLINALLFNWWLPKDAALLFLSLVTAALLIDLGKLRVRLPQNARQVPERIELRGPRAGALQFGVEMGTGLRTFMTSALPHAIAVYTLVALPVDSALAAGLGFGAGRSLVPLARAIPGNESNWTPTFDRFSRSIRATLASGLLLGAVVQAVEIGSVL